MIQFLLMVASAVVGVGVQRAVLASESSFQQMLSRRKTARLRAGASSAADGPIELIAGLEQCRVTHAEAEALLPLAWRKEGVSHQEVRPHADGPFVAGSSTIDWVADRGSDLKEVEKAARRPYFDGHLCYVKPVIQLQAAEPMTTLGRCNYVAYANVYAGRVLAARKKGAARTRALRRWERRFQDGLLDGSVPATVGAVVALVHSKEGEWVALQHRRSSEVLVSPGTTSYLPVFGLESEQRIYASAFGLVQHNVLRELGEELYSVPELGGLTESTRLDVDWFTHVSPVSDLLASWEAGEFRLEYLGCVLNFQNANVQLLLMAVHRDDSGWLNLLSEAQPNWEVEATPAGRQELRFESVGVLATSYADGRRDLSPASVMLDQRMREVLA